MAAIVELVIGFIVLVGLAVGSSCDVERIANIVRMLHRSGSQYVRIAI